MNGFIKAMDKIIWITVICILLICLSDAKKYGGLKTKCEEEKGSCMAFSQCDTSTHIYKGYCKTDYSQVCCVSRASICDAHDGICTDDPDACEAAGAIMGMKYQIQFKNWLSCNTTHTCCRPIPKDRVKGMSEFKSQFPEIEKENFNSQEKAAISEATNAAFGSTNGIQAQSVLNEVDDEEAEELTEEERQAKIGEAVLAVLAENPSMSLQEAMQHPNVMIAAGEQPYQPIPTQQPYGYPNIYQPGFNQQGAQIARVGGFNPLTPQLNPQLNPQINPQRRAALLMRRRRLQQLRQAALSARKAQILAAQQQQQQELINHQQNMLNSEIQKRMYSSGTQDPFNTPEYGFQNQGGQQYQQGFYSPGFPKQGSSFEQDTSQRQTHQFTNRLLGSVKIDVPNVQQQPVPSGGKFGFKDNNDFLKDFQQQNFAANNPLSLVEQQALLEGFNYFGGNKRYGS